MNDLFSAPPQKLVFSVTQLNREVRELLECNYGTILLEGEISNFSRPASGHFYFSLKDARAQIRCAMFKGNNRYLRVQPKNGMQVQLRGRLSLYEARGEFQFIAEHLEEAGEGQLQRQFEKTKQQLQAKGLFADKHKKPIPSFPTRIGIITSPTGAAIHDVISVLKRRFPGASVIIYPTPVQGDAAISEISRMIRLAAERKECDVLLLIRGGGSLEDLWAFNEVSVAEAIYTCPLPVVSGVGHEIDFTIADMVADKRAPTPSAAAELVSPDAEMLLQRVETLTRRLLRVIPDQFEQINNRTQALEARLKTQHPERKLVQQAQICDELEMRLQRGLKRLMAMKNNQFEQNRQRLFRSQPGDKIERMQSQLEKSAQQLQYLQKKKLDNLQNRLQVLVRGLDNVSPLSTLQRGYAVVTEYSSGHVVRDALAVKEGEKVVAQLAKGQLVCTVDSRED